MNTKHRLGTTRSVTSHLRPSVSLVLSLGLLPLLCAATGCARAGRATTTPPSAVDLGGVEQSVLGSGVASVVLIVAVDCPISNAYAPEMERIHGEYSAQGVSFSRVYCDPDVEPERIRSHGEEFGLTMPALLDYEHGLVRHVGARVVPTAVLFGAGGEILYRGRIDDRYVDFGKRRAEPTVRDLRRALDEVLTGGRPAVDETDAVGCFIGELVGRE